MNDKERVEMVREALRDHFEGKLTEGACIMAIHVVVNSEEPTEEGLEWAREAIRMYEMAEGGDHE